MGYGFSIIVDPIDVQAKRGSDRIISNILGDGELVGSVSRRLGKWRLEKRMLRYSTALYSSRVTLTPMVTGVRTEREGRKAALSQFAEKPVGITFKFMQISSWNLSRYAVSGASLGSKTCTCVHLICLAVLCSTGHEPGSAGGQGC